MGFNILLLILLSICVFTDLKSRKIYNIVIFPSLLLSLIVHLVSNGLPGLWFSLSGFLVGLAILLIPYFMGGIGAGDVKLLAVIGALKGTMFVLATSVYMALIGGLIGLVVLLFRKGGLSRIKSIIYSISSFGSGLRVPLFLDKEGLQTTYPYGVAIAGGAVISLVYGGGILW
ncbi:A24 family peptidase [Bacillus sp. DJP31]|uniref:A24 family peptidase n=1 Tax=Bacillus sp. DJP31 TaxID=3409789 RepID=UPI003BB78CFC